MSSLHLFSIFVPPNTKQSTVSTVCCQLKCKTVNSVALECCFFIMHSILIKVETCIKKYIHS